MSPQLQDSFSTSNSTPTLSPLQQYAKEIAAAADTITKYCTEQKLPQLSFDALSAGAVLPDTATLAVQDARQQLIASAVRIQQLATEPAEYLPHLQIHYQVLSALDWLIHFDIFAQIPTGANESISYSKLAATASVPESQLRSVARMAMTSNLLREPSPDHVAHNAISLLFVNDIRYVNWAKFMTRFSAPTAAAFSSATAKWGVTDRKHETAFNISTQHEGPLFDYFAKSTDLADCFASYMAAVQSSRGTSLTHLVSGFDWASLGSSQVIDVGGSTCSCSIALAKAFPDLRFVVEDLPETIGNASKLLAAQPEHISSRISTKPHDFFTPQPLLGARVYLLRMILHDWPRAHALSILRNLLPALKADAASRMVIMDTVLPPPGTTSPVEEALLRVRDLTMIQSFNSKERELGEFEELFAETKDGEGRLVLQAWRQPAGSVLSVLEVAYERYS